MTTRSTEDAMSVLEERRAALIAAARQVAVDLIQKEGFAHSRSVRAEMVRRGLLEGYDGKDFWLGAVFRTEQFESAGRWFDYSDSSRNIHERRVHVWKLSTKRPAPAAPSPVPVADPPARKARRSRKKVAEGQLALF